MSYLRMHALIYAGVFWNRVCHDGRVATKKGYPKEINKVKLTPGLPFADVGFIDGEEDCTHFLSCCVGNGRGKITVGGRTIEIRGGGLLIPSPFQGAGIYGETYVPRGIGALTTHGAKIVPPQFRVTSYDTTKAAILEHLTPGDVLAYASKDNASSYEHMAILVGPTTIACHSRHRFGQEYTDVYFPWVTLLKLP
jgi:hypothetical protein